MNRSVKELKEWFKGLDDDDQHEIVKFLYEGDIFVENGYYSGPVPGVISKGLHCGPISQAMVTSSNTSAVCPTCHKKW